MNNTQIVLRALRVAKQDTSRFFHDQVFAFARGSIRSNDRHERRAGFAVIGYLNRSVSANGNTGSASKYQQGRKKYAYKH